MSGIRHPFTGHLYEDASESRVRVTAADGRSGLFTAGGQWLEGDLKEADPQLCGWVGGPRVANHRVGEVASS